MRVLLLLAAVALAPACKKTNRAKATDAAPVAAVPLDAAPVAVAPPAAPDGPLTPATAAGKPGIQVKGVEYEGIEEKMLPAIRDDGSQIAALTVADDGGRGYLQLSFHVLDARSNKTVEHQVLVDPDETNKAQGDDGTIAPAVLDGIRQRVAAANALLDRSTWRALEAGSAPDDDPDAPIAAAGITWTLDEKLRLIGKRGDKVVFDKTFTQLTGKPAPKASDDDDMCPEIVVLEAVYFDAASDQALVYFGRESGHNCGAPGADLAVIALPR